MAISQRPSLLNGNVRRVQAQPSHTHVYRHSPWPEAVRVLRTLRDAPSGSHAHALCSTRLIPTYAMHTGRPVARRTFTFARAQLPIPSPPVPLPIPVPPSPQARSTYLISALPRPVCECAGPCLLRAFSPLSDTHRVLPLHWHCMSFCCIRPRLNVLSQSCAHTPDRARLPASHLRFPSVQTAGPLNLHHSQRTRPSIRAAHHPLASARREQEQEQKQHLRGARPGMSLTCIHES